MITLNDKLVEYAKKKNHSVVISLIKRPETSCGWGGGTSSIPTRSLRVETRKCMERPKFYRESEHKGIKIFTQKGINISNNAEINFLNKVLFFPPVLEAKGFS